MSSKHLFCISFKNAQGGRGPTCLSRCPFVSALRCFSSPEILMRAHSPSLALRSSLRCRCGCGIPWWANGPVCLLTDKTTKLSRVACVGRQALTLHFFAESTGCTFVCLSQIEGDLVPNFPLDNANTKKRFARKCRYAGLSPNWPKRVTSSWAAEHLAFYKLDRQNCKPRLAEAKSSKWAGAANRGQANEDVRGTEQQRVGAEIVVLGLMLRRRKARVGGWLLHVELRTLFSYSVARISCCIRTGPVPCPWC